MITPERGGRELGVGLLWATVVVLAMLGTYAYWDLRSRLERPSSQPDAEDETSGAVDAVPHSGTDQPEVCSGEVSQASVQQALAARGNAVFACYEQHAGTDRPRMQLLLRLRVGRSGEVEAVDVRAAAVGSGLVECVSGVGRTMRFAVPTNGTCAWVELPFLLGATGAETAN